MTFHCPVKASHPCVFHDIFFLEARMTYSEEARVVAAWMAGASKLEPYWAWFSRQPCSCIIAEWPDPHVAGAWTTTLPPTLEEPFFLRDIFGIPHA